MIAHTSKYVIMFNNFSTTYMFCSNWLHLWHKHGLWNRSFLNVILYQIHNTICVINYWINILNKAIKRLVKIILIYEYKPARQHNTIAGKLDQWKKHLSMYKIIVINSIFSNCFPTFNLCSSICFIAWYCNEINLLNQIEHKNVD